MDPVNLSPKLPSLDPRGTVEERKALLHKATQDFESIFLDLMLGAMRKTVDKNPLVSGGRGEETFQPLLDQQFAAGAAHRGGGLGIGAMLYKSLEKHVVGAGAVDVKG